MVFSSSLFLVYFLPCFLILYYCCPHKYKNTALLLASIVFYSWGAPRFIFVLLVTTFIDFHLAKMIHQSATRRRKALLLTVSLIINLGLLFLLKYSPFFLNNINVFLSMLKIDELPMIHLFLPIGISFYTFETITYLVDVYRGVQSPLKKFNDYLVYILMFPKLIAGPIVRYHEIAAQIEDRSQNETYQDRISGFHRFCIGLGKKTLIANSLGSFVIGVDAVDPAMLTTSTAWMAALAYSFQIYFDFSGYTDMALGLGKMIGFKLPENFNNPYLATSITDFWQKWHISLGTWMKNYLYIPLGGNRLSVARTFFNLWLVFILSGLWHGAAWNFVLWGLYHGLWMICERKFLSQWMVHFPRGIKILVTFGIVTVGWVIFRIESIPTLLTHLHVLSGSGAFSDDIPVDRDIIALMSIALFFSWFCFNTLGRNIQKTIYEGNLRFKGMVALTITMFALYILSLAYVTGSSFNPFIYFRF